ncbi:hypothetical protein O6H91_17G003500 [Diphasiastrum complanatum]|nr:hypothetical protein O6H91_17G003500 [Diphasiastrum complanatum]
MEEISAVVDWFNSRAQQLLDCHLASGFRKYLLLFKRSVATDQRALIQEGKILVNYASMNAIAIRKILKKYDKVHSCDEGRAFRARLQTMHAELLQSPWLIELAALYINLSDSNSSTTLSLPDGFAICKWDFNGDRPVILCTLLDSLKLELDLTCSICLDTVFDPVSLACGHIFCNSCACSAASILTVQGLKVANRAAKCPLCRLDDVYMSALHLAELNILIKNRCRGYWEERLQRERTERLQQVKEHWDKQVQAVMGL